MKQVHRHTSILLLAVLSACATPPGQVAASEESSTTVVVSEIDRCCEDCGRLELRLPDGEVLVGDFAALDRTSVATAEPLPSSFTGVFRGTRGTELKCAFQLDEDASQADGACRSEDGRELQLKSKSLLHATTDVVLVPALPTERCDGDESWTPAKHSPWCFWGGC